MPDDAEPQTSQAEHMDKLITEMEAHRDRIKLLAAAPETTVSMAMSEMADTVMTLLKDFASLTLGEVVILQADMDELLEELPEPGGEPEDSVLYPDDADAITRHLLAYRELLSNMLKVADAAHKGQIQVVIDDTDTTLARVAEITNDEPPEEEDEEEDEDEADGGDGDGDEEAAPAVAAKRGRPS